jgi:drug/metabolite transporter (DMT)-like permease
VTERATGFVLLAATIVLNATGQLLLKRASLGRAPGAGVIEMFLSPWFVGGAAAHAATMIVWLLALRRLPLTVAHPLTGAVFVIVPVASHLFWSESLGLQRLIGILVIVLGIAVVASASS